MTREDQNLYLRQAENGYIPDSPPAAAAAAIVRTAVHVPAGGSKGRHPYMTELLDGVEAPSDAELISRVRGGDVAAYGDLFARHVDAARRLGWQLVRGPDVDDLVSDAFAKTLAVLQNGGGPDVAFRAYLLTSLRRLHIDKLRAAKKVQPAEDMTVFDAGVPFRDSAVANFDNGAAAKAFASLPERWQLVLWHLEVEGQKPADIAPLLGMSPNSVSALAYRAREGLRQAFLRMHLSDSPTERCRWVNEHLGAYVRKGLSKRDTTNVEEHLDGCRRCTAMYLELDEVNSNLAGIVAPLLLGAAAAGYVSSAGSAGATGVSAFFGRVRDAVSGNGTGAGAGAGGSAAGAGAGAVVTSGGLVTVGGLVAASVVAITAAAFVVGGGSDKEVVIEADQPVGIVQTPVPPAESESVESPADPEQDREGDVEALADDSVSAAGAHFQDEASVETSGEQPLHQEADGAGVTPVGTADAPPAPSAGDPAPQPATRPGSAPRDSPGDTDTEPAPGDTAAEPAPGDTAADPATTPPPAEENDTPAGQPGQQPPAQDPGTDQPGSEQPPAQPEPDAARDLAPQPEAAPVSPPQPTTTNLAVRAFDMAEGTASLTFTGTSLESSVQLRVQSLPTGITIAEGGDCTPDPMSPGFWLCSPTGVTVTSVFSQMFASALPEAPASAEYTVSVPLDIPADQADRTTVTFEYLVKGEAALPGTHTTSALRIANAQLSAPAILGTTAGGQHRVVAELGGVPAEDGEVLYMLDGEAAFVPDGAGGCSVDVEATTLRCANPTAGTTEFLLLSNDPSTSTTVSLSVAPFAGFLDPDRANNTIRFELPAAPAFAFDGAPIVTDVDNGQFKSVEVPLIGVKVGDEVHLQLSANLSGSSAFFCRPPCDAGQRPTTATVAVKLGSEGRTVVDFVAKLPGASPVTLTATLDGQKPASVQLSG